MSNELTWGLPDDPVKWETVVDEAGQSTGRLAVPGGWMYRVILWGTSEGGESDYWTMSLCFVPVSRP